MSKQIGRTYTEAQERADRDTRTLGSEVLRRAKRRPRTVAVVDGEGALGRLRLVSAARALLPALELGDNERRVGVLLPPGRGGTLINVALALDGRTAVNLNHTAGVAQVERMCSLSDVRTVLSSHRYLQRIEERMNGEVLPEGLRVLKVEDLLTAIDKRRVVLEMAKVMLLPPRLLDRGHPDQVAVIVFSSGTTGDPKGVQLTHRQVLANCDSVVEGVPIDADTGALLTPLPLFHSFGLVPGMWMPLIRGVTVAGQPDPFDAVGFGELAAKAKATYMMATPTFVRGYMRRVKPEQLSTLEFAIVGAERCPAELNAAFKDKYGAPLLEGYGCTELAPCVAFNTLSTNKQGSVGRPLSGIEVLLMHPETKEVLPQDPESEGLLVVRSAARMLGYLGRPDLTAEVFVHGGYNTGDICRIDQEGYVTITGRLARFAKIGGEMIPLDNIESLLQDWLDDRDADVQVAVAAVHDARKGERLVVLFSGKLPVEPAEMLDSALSTAPALWRPRAKDVHPVEEVPLLGTGKRDLGRLDVLAAGIAGTPGDPEVGKRARGLAEGVRGSAVDAREGVGRLIDQVRHRETRQRGESSRREPEEGEQVEAADGVDSAETGEGSDRPSEQS